MQVRRSGAPASPRWTPSRASDAGRRRDYDGLAQSARRRRGRGPKPTHQPRNRTAPAAGEKDAPRLSRREGNGANGRRAEPSRHPADAALSQVRPKSSKHFWNLAALQIRRELLELARQRKREKTLGDGDGKAADDPGGPLLNLPDGGDEPASLEAWTRLHKEIERLPEREREVVDLLWYGGLTQQEAGEVLGVTVYVVRHRWLSARLKLARRLSDDPPR